jgi:HK97 family phage major capsid protein
MAEVNGFNEKEQAELKTAFSKIESELGTKVADQVKDTVEKAMKSKDDEIDGLKKWKVSKEEADAKNQKWIDEQIAKGKNIVVEADDKNLGGALSKAFNERKDELASYTKSGRRSMQFELKTVGNIASGNFTTSGTHGFVNPTEFHAPGRKPYEISHIRDLVRVVPLGPSTDVYVIRDAGGEGAPTSVAAGAAKPQSDRDWVKTIVPITKLAHYYKVPEEYLADITWLQDEITGVGVEELMSLEDSKFLTNSAAGEFNGLNQTFNSTAFSAPASLALGVLDPNNYDVLVAAWTQLRILKSAATAVLLHPADYAAMIISKDENNNYLFGAPNQVIPNLFGAPIIPHTAVTSDKYFLGDFSKVKVGQRAGLSVRFYDQNEDDAIKNMVTIVIEERVTMAADRNDRIIYGDFSDNANSLYGGS